LMILQGQLLKQWLTKIPKLDFKHGYHQLKESIDGAHCTGNSLVHIGLT